MRLAAAARSRREVRADPGGSGQASAPGWPWQRTAGVVSLIAAGGGLVLGVAGTVLQQGRAGDFNDVCTVPHGSARATRFVVDEDFDCRGKYDWVKAAERMMWIGYVGGGVLAAAGVTLLLLAPRADQPRALAWAGRCAPTSQRLAGTGVACGWTSERARAAMGRSGVVAAGGLHARWT